MDFEVSMGEWDDSKHDKPPSLQSDSKMRHLNPFYVKINFRECSRGGNYDLFLHVANSGGPDS